MQTQHSGDDHPVIHTGPEREHWTWSGVLDTTQHFLVVGAFFIDKTYVPKKRKPTCQTKENVYKLVWINFSKISLQKEQR